VINGEIYYRADGHPDVESHDRLEQSKVKKIKWKPSIFMKREYVRLFGDIQNIRLERLQDIAAEDVVREGVWVDQPPGVNAHKPDHWDEWTEEKKDKYAAEMARCVYIAQTHHVDMLFKAFRKLWDGLNAKDGHGWEKNPWVWVIEFERVEVLE
jgi:hypothetical protein